MPTQAPTPIQNARSLVSWRTALGVLLAGGAALVFLALLNPNKPTPAPAVHQVGPIAPGTYPTDPLPAGSVLPQLRAAGWVNGAPASAGNQLVVLDVWAHWCPGCRETAPGLVQAYHKFASRGVSFVSLTNIDRAGVEKFVKSFDVPWPAGYGGEMELFAELGAYAPDRIHGGYKAGYEVSPTLYLTDPAGRVLWNDNRARPRHLKTSDDVVGELVAQIERALGPTDGH